MAEVLDQAIVVETLAWCVGLLGDEDIPQDRIGTAHAHPVNLVNPKALFVPKRLLARSPEGVISGGELSDSGRDLHGA